MTWEPPTDDGGSDITGYLVEWSANRRAKPLGELIEDPEARTHTITGLRNTTVANPSEYYVWISAINAAGQGELTTAPNGQPVSPSTVGADLPAELAVTPSATSGTELIAEWRAPRDDGGEPVQHYRVERNCVTSTGATGWVTTGIPGNPAGRVDVPNIPTEKYSITIIGLGNGQPCEIRVRAVNAKTSANGPWRWASATATPVQVPGPQGSTQAVCCQPTKPCRSPGPRQPTQAAALSPATKSPTRRAEHPYKSASPAQSLQQPSPDSATASATPCRSKPYLARARVNPHLK